jgi:hypothetical protein
MRHPIVTSMLLVLSIANKHNPHVQTSEPWVNIHLHINGGISQRRSVLCNGQVLH